MCPGNSPLRCPYNSGPSRIVMPGSAVWGALGWSEVLEGRDPSPRRSLPSKDGYSLACAPPGAEHPAPLLSPWFQPQHCPWVVRWHWRRWLGQLHAKASVRILSGWCVRGQGAWCVAFENVTTVTTTSSSNSLWVVNWEMCYQNSLPWYWRGFVDERKVVLTVENSFSFPLLPGECKMLHSA